MEYGIWHGIWEWLAMEYGNLLNGLGRYLICLACESRYWEKRKLSPVLVIICQINQISGKHLTVLFYYFRLEF